jgi:hypothetical protein
MIYGMASIDSASLDRLHDVIVPPPVPWWPPAPGWYWILGFVFFVVLALLLRTLLQWLHNCYRREALDELARQEANLADATNRAAAITKIAELLKRTALSVFPRETVASLTGPAWFAFLNSTRGRAKTLPDDKGEWFERMAYEPNAAKSVDERQAREFVSFARDWIAHHRATQVTGGNNP